MIPHHYQAASMHQNPQLARSIEETVSNLKNLELCIDALRNDLAFVAEATGNIQAAQRVLTPANQTSQFGAASPWDIQQQASHFGNPLAQSPLARINAPWATAFNPYAVSAVSPLANVSPGVQQASPFGVSSINPWQAQQQQLQQVRLAELSRQQAVSPWATTNPWAISSPWAQVSPYASPSAFTTPSTMGVSPYAQQSAFSVPAGISPYALQSPFSVPRAAAFSPYTQAASLGVQTPLAHHDVAARQLTGSSLSPTASIGPF